MTRSSDDGRDLELDTSPKARKDSSLARDRWMGVEIRHLEALAAIAREGSFRGAADALGYVQSAVSQQLAKLEGLIGVRLIERSRGNGSIALTAAGALLLEHTEEILARYGRANAELAALAAGETGTLRVGMLQSVAARLLPRVLPPFASRCPGVQLVPTERPSDTSLFEALEAGELDLVFCEEPLMEGPFEAEKLMDDPVLLVVPVDSPLALRGTAPQLAELGELPFIAYGRWRAQSEVHEWLRAHGIRPRIAFSSDHNATVQSLVAAGMGVALGPLLAVDPTHPGTALLRLAEDPPARSVALAWRRETEPSPPAEAFREVARSVCSQRTLGPRRPDTAAVT